VPAGQEVAAMRPVRQVNFLCQFNQTGVGRHCENAFFAMVRNRRAGLLLEYVDQTREHLVRQAMASTGKDDVTLFFWRYPHDVLQRFAGRRVIWWFFESDRLAARWLHEIAPYDEIWAPSAWGRRVLLAHGVPPQRIRVVASGVNIEVFRPAAVAHEGFVFLTVGKYERRKSIDEVIDAFAAEFPAAAYPQVQLWLKADFPAFPDRVHTLARRLAHDARVRVISGNFSDEQMAAIYNAADAFVFPSKAEGFGLPCLEAIACGLPAIVTNVTAQSEFLDRIAGLYEPVDFTVGPIVDEDYAHFYADDYGGTDFGNWALPSIDSIRQAMRRVFEDPPHYRRKALAASELVRAEFSWDAIGRRAVSAIAQIPPAA
jgi:glycosyltransferase involved in cell wall biosynthesis